MNEIDADGRLKWRVDMVVNEIFEDLERKVRKALGEHGKGNKSINIGMAFWRPPHDGQRNVHISFNFNKKCDQLYFKKLSDLDKWATETIRRREILFRKFDRNLSTEDALDIAARNAIEETDMERLVSEAEYKYIGPEDETDDIPF